MKRMINMNDVRNMAAAQVVVCFVALMVADAKEASDYGVCDVKQVSNRTAVRVENNHNYGAYDFHLGDCGKRDRCYNKSSRINKEGVRVRAKVGHKLTMNNIY